MLTTNRFSLARRFSNQSLARQLLAAFALVLVVVLGAGSFTLWTTLVNEQAGDRVTHVYAILDLTQGALNAVSEMETSYEGFLLTANPAYLDRYAAGEQIYQRKLAQLQVESISPTLIALWRDLEARDVAMQRDVIDPAIATRRASDGGTESTPAALGDATLLFDALHVDFNKALATERNALSIRILQSDQASQRMLVVLVGGMLLATTLALTIAYRLARNIGAAVGELARAAQRMAQGDLASRVELRRSDEVGQAAAAFNRMADHLQRTIDKTESILNSAGEGIMGSDAEHGLVFVNPAAATMLGYAADELIGKQAHATFHHSYADGTPFPAELCAVHLTLLDGVTRRLTDEVMWRKDGSCFPVEYICGRLRGSADGHGAVVTFRDITDRKQLEDAQYHLVSELRRQGAELQRSNRELQDFASIASHDLQEPLRKVQAFGGRLHQKCYAELGQDGRLYLDRMQDAAGRMQTLITDLLVFSRVGSQARAFVELDLDKVVSEVISDLEVTIERCGARLEVAPLPTLKADAVQMRQLFQNLISNGLKFRRPGVAPHLRIASRCIAADGRAPTSTWYEISVADNGIGFDEKYLDRIFTIFQRLHGRSEYEGTGVGLAVCRKIVDRHGGTLTARSVPDHGSTFLITLPSAPPAAGATHAA